MGRQVLPHKCACPPWPASLLIKMFCPPLCSAVPVPRRPHPACTNPAGGWYDPQQAEGDGQYVMSPAGSPPALVDSFLQGGPEAGR